MNTLSAVSLISILFHSQCCHLSIVHYSLYVPLQQLPLNLPTFRYFLFQSSYYIRLFFSSFTLLFKNLHYYPSGYQINSKLFRVTFNSFFVLPYILSSNNLTCCLCTGKWVLISHTLQPLIPSHPGANASFILST